MVDRIALIGLLAIGLVVLWHLWLELRQLRLVLTRILAVQDATKLEAGRQAQQGSAPEPVRWEYIVVSWKWDAERVRFSYWVNAHLDEGLSSDWRGPHHVLGLLGAKGWELAAVPTDADGVDKAYYFKRPLPRT